MNVRRAESGCRAMAALVKNSGLMLRIRAIDHVVPVSSVADRHVQQAWLAWLREPFRLLATRPEGEHSDLVAIPVGVPRLDHDRGEIADRALPAHGLAVLGRSPEFVDRVAFDERLAVSEAAEEELHVAAGLVVVARLGEQPPAESDDRSR